MNLLIAEDDPVLQRLLQTQLRKWNYDPIVAVDGKQAWEAASRVTGPLLAILDWMMPEMDGIEVCRRLRQAAPGGLLYVILLTARDRKEDLIEAFEAGANDYIVKPCHSGELRARIQAGQQVLDLQTQLATRVKELEAALREVSLLQGLLPICSYCKSIHAGKGDWKSLERYFEQHTEAKLSHSICPECLAAIVEPQLQAMEGTK